MSRSRRGASLVLPALTLILALMIAAPATSQVLATSSPGPTSPAELQLERLRAAMQAWSQGRKVSQDEVRAVYSARADPRKSSVSGCIRSVEEDLSSYLETTDPSMLPTLAVWHTQMLLESIDWADQPTLRSQDFDRIADYLKTYRRRAPRRVESLSRKEAEVDAAVVWSGLGEVFARYGSRSFYELAQSALDRALEIDKDLRFARYLHAWVGEKLHGSLDMMRPWRELFEDYPDRAEYRLRFGVNAAAASRREKAVEQLVHVARGNGDEWMRALAYETWVQLLLDPARGGSPDHEDAAREILREARSELSAWPSLDLLASSLDLKDRPARALRLAERVEAHVWPEGEISPLLRYELPNPDELVEMRAHLIQVLGEGQRKLNAYLHLLDGGEVLRRQSLQACD